MTLRLHLVRHALAATRDDERWPDDNGRPLTKEGVRYFRKVAAGVARAMPAPATVLSSPSLRAWQTAELLVEAGWPSPEAFTALLPGGDPNEVTSALPDDGRLALIGHSPDLGRIASLLLTGDPDQLSVEMKKGAILTVEFERETGRATLKSLAQPTMLRRVG